MNMSILIFINVNTHTKYMLILIHISFAIIFVFSQSLFFFLPLGTVQSGQHGREQRSYLKSIETRDWMALGRP